MGDSPDIVAAIDMGTNSTRLLVHDGTETVDRRMRITRLGQDVDRTGRLADEAIDRVLRCLEEYRAVMDAHGVDRVRAVATSAARDADNRADFFDAVEAVIGVRPELLSGLEEGALSFRGATADLDEADGPFLVFDIGGEGDQSFNDSAAAGLARAAEELGVSTSKVSPNDDGSNRAELLQLQADSSDIVLAVGFLFAGDAATVSAANPETSFAVSRPDAGSLNPSKFGNSVMYSEMISMSGFTAFAPAM